MVLDVRVEHECADHTTGRQLSDGNRNRTHWQRINEGELLAIILVTGLNTKGKRVKYEQARKNKLGASDGACL